MPSTTVVRNPLQTCRHQPTCGCNYAGCCFECPLPDCRFIEPHYQEITDTESYSGQRPLERRDCDLRRMKASRERRTKAVELWHSGLDITEIAGAMGMHYKTIWEYLREVRRNGKQEA